MRYKNAVLLLFKHNAMSSNHYRHTHMCREGFFCSTNQLFTRLSNADCRCYFWHSSLTINNTEDVCFYNSQRLIFLLSAFLPNITSSHLWCWSLEARVQQEACQRKKNLTQTLNWTTQEKRSRRRAVRQYNLPGQTCWNFTCFSVPRRDECTFLSSLRKMEIATHVAQNVHTKLTILRPPILALADDEDSFRFRKRLPRRYFRRDKRRTCSHSEANPWVLLCSFRLVFWIQGDLNKFVDFKCKWFLGKLHIVWDMFFSVCQRLSTTCVTHQVVRDLSTNGSRLSSSFFFSNIGSLRSCCAIDTNMRCNCLNRGTTWKGDRFGRQLNM